MLGQQRVVADDEPLAGVVRAADFGQMTLIEQGELNRLALHQTANLVVAQDRDPAQSRMTLQMVDLRLGQQPAVPHQHHPLQTEPTPYLLHLIGHRGRIPRVAGIGLHRQGTPHRVGQHTVDHYGPVPFAVPIVAELHQGAGLAFVVTAADVIEHRVAFSQVPLGQLALNAVLTLQQPVHGLIEIVLVSVLQGEFLGQGGGVPQTGGGQLGGRMQQPLDDHGQDPVPFGRGSGVDQRRQLQPPHGFQQQLDMAMRQGAFDDEELVGVDQGFVFEHAPEALDLVLGPMGEIGQGAFMDLFTLTAAFAQEDGRGRVTVGDGFDVHGTILPHIDFM